MRSILLIVLTAIFSTVALAESWESKLVSPFVTYSFQDEHLSLKATVTSEAVLNEGHNNSYRVSGQYLSNFQVTYNPSKMDQVGLSMKGLSLGSKAFVLTANDLESSVLNPNIINSVMGEYDSHHFEFRVKNRPDLPFDRILVFEKLNRVAFVRRGSYENFFDRLRRFPKDYLNDQQWQFGRGVVKTAKTEILQPILPTEDGFIHVRADLKGKTTYLHLKIDSTGYDLVNAEVSKYGEQKNIVGDDAIVSVEKILGGFRVNYNDGSQLMLANEDKEVSVIFNGERAKTVKIYSVNLGSQNIANRYFPRSHFRSEKPLVALQNVDFTMLRKMDDNRKELGKEIDRVSEIIESHDLNFVESFDEAALVKAKTAFIDFLDVSNLFDLNSARFGDLEEKLKSISAKNSLSEDQWLYLRKLMWLQKSQQFSLKALRKAIAIQINIPLKMNCYEAFN